MTTVVNVRNETCDVYIGRTRNGVGLWGNPFKIGRDGNRAEVIEKYEAYIRKRLEREPKLVRSLLALEGKRLGCWCKPAPCHGDVLVKLINEYKQRSGRAV